MDKVYLNDLKKLDTRKLAASIANRLRVIEETKNYRSNNYHLKGMVVAYVLYQATKNPEVSLATKEAFENSCNIPEFIKSYLDTNLKNAWEVVTNLKGKYSLDELLAYILFNNDVEDYRTENYSTPSGLLKLACSILDIQENDEVLELCSGKGNFCIEAFSTEESFSYTGIELNHESNAIAQIRSELLDKDIKLVLNNVFEYSPTKKADKLFANYPFMGRTVSMNEHKRKIIKELSIPEDVIRRASSDWVFNIAIIEQMKKNGKAVAIMTNGAGENAPDEKIRQYFIENGYIEAIVSLPAGLFNYFSIPTTLVVFSHNNKTIKMVDASKICIKRRRNNSLIDENIAEILSLLKHDGEKAITKDIYELAKNEYNLNATHYLEVLPEIINGVELSTVVRNITRGAQIKADDLTEKKSSEPTSYKYLTLANINDGILSFNDEQYLKEVPSNLSKFCVKNHSIILTRNGFPEIKSAVAQVEEDTQLLATGNLMIVELDETKVNPYYLQAFFTSEIGKLLLKSICAGTVLPTISLSKLKSLMIPLPSMEEQNRIGNKYVEAMNEVILLKRKLEKSLEEMKQIYDKEK